MLVQLKEVYKIYGEGLESEVRALDGVSLEIERGEFVAIVGQSGSGKSTMMNVLGCLDVPTRGDYFLDGTDVRELSDKELSHIRNKQIGFIFQQYTLIQSLTVLENVELPLIYQGIGAAARRDMALEALDRVGLADRVRHRPTEMSGGQQQRVAIARAIATRPPIIMADEPTGALDSHTGQDVLRFLQELNREGSTVILITHDNGIAATARHCRHRSSVCPAAGREDRGGPAAGGGLAVNIRQAMKMAWKSILGKKGRSFLTMLGIIIGIASVMTIVSTVNGMNQESMKQFEAMGTNKINVSAYRYDGQDVFDDLYDFCNSMGSDLVLGITPDANLWDMTVVYGSKNSKNMQKNEEQMWSSDGEPNAELALPPSCYLGSDQYAMCNNLKIKKGRDISNVDIRNYNQVCVLGSRAAKNFFNYADPVGQTMQVNGLPFTVVGVYESRDTSNSPYSMDNLIVFPYSTRRVLSPSTTINQFVVKATSSAATTEVISRLNGFLAGMTNNGQSGSGNAYSENQWQESQNEYLNMISLVLGGIAAISLLVGGIGIMNIMLVTVTERTREIGIRRAIGAERGAIVTQFLIEAAMLCGIGGVVGILIGTAATRAAGKLLMKLSIWPSVQITLCAFLLSVVLGVLFGIYPAAKASKLQPVEALRAE